MLAGCGGDEAPRVGGSASGGSEQQPGAGTPGSSGQPGATASPAAITITSPAFPNGGQIPTRYTCHGQNVSPPLSWTGVPTTTTALALVVDDPDAVGGRYVHWVVSDIVPEATGTAEGTPPPGGQVHANSGGDRRYLGPCPPAGTGVHHYRFTLYAMTKRGAVPESAPAREATTAITNAAAAQGQLVGTYSG